MNNMKALIAMSGGVDSSVSAKLIQDRGLTCIGCTMQLFDYDDPLIKAGSCSAPDNVKDAGAVCARLGMDYHVLDLKEEFRRCVMEPFAASYAAGMTPNPCIDCNRNLKFGRLLAEADRLDCRYIVTGHYARIDRDETSGRFRLRKAADESKDQSYVLYNLTQEQMARVILPLGEMPKTQAREIAERNGFINANRPDSQDICFVPDGDYAAAVERISGLRFPQGDFLDLDGNVIGTHKGIIHYTIGQTRRLGQAFGQPRYVCAIDGSRGTVTLGGPDDVYSSYAKAGLFNWTSGIVPAGEIRCRVRTRYKQKEQPATVRPLPGEEAAEIFFDEPQRAITPGQAAVLYDGDEVLGGGTILNK